MSEIQVLRVPPTSMRSDHLTKIKGLKTVANREIEDLIIWNETADALLAALLEGAGAVKCDIGRLRGANYRIAPNDLIPEGEYELGVMVLLPVPKEGE